MSIYNFMYTKLHLTWIVSIENKYFIHEIAMFEYIVFPLEAFNAFSLIPIAFKL